MTLKPLVAASFDWDAMWAWLSGIPIRLVLIVVFGIVANVAARRSINHIVARIPEGERESRSNSRSRTVGAVLKSSITVMIVAVVAMLILSQLGIDLAPLIASAGVAGVALGFGAQTLVRDVLAGMFVLIEDQYGVGDVVDVGPASGTVEKITLRATVVRDEAGTVWHVPNGEIRRAGNKSQRWSRALIDVTVDAESDIDAVLAQLELVAEQIAADPDWTNRLLERPRVLGVQSLAHGGATVRIVADTEPASQWQVERHLRLLIKSAFDRSGIKIAASVVSPFVSPGTRPPTTPPV